MERTTFDRLMMDQLAGLLRFAIRLTGSVDAAEDLVQETVLRAIDRHRSLREAKRLRSWLYQILVNRFRDRLRSARRINATGDDVVSIDAGPSQIAAGRELGQRVAKAVSLLPARQREVLVMIAFEGFDPIQAAVILGISHQSVRTNLHLARQRLRNVLQDDLPKRDQQ